MLLLYYQFFAVLTAVANVEAQPAVPTITDAPDFIGYIRQGSNFEAVICDHGLFTTSRYWAACVETSQRAVPTRCQDDSIIVLPETTSLCPSPSHCRTDFYFNNLLDNEPLSLVGCVTGTRTSYIFRETDKTGTLSESTAGPTTTTTSNSSPSSTGSVDTPRTSSPNLGVILGAVFGGIVLIAAIAFGIWYFFIWKPKNSAQPGPNVPPEPVGPFF